MDVSMPQLGETVTEGTITRWLKGVGDTVRADEPLFEVSTDKVDSEVPAPAAGVLTEIRVPEGDTVAVGTVLAVIGDAGSAPAPVTAPEPVAAEPAPASRTRARARAGGRAGARARGRWSEPEPEPEPEPVTADRAASLLPSLRTRPSRRRPRPTTRASPHRSCADSWPSTASTRPPSRAPAPGAASPARTCSTRRRSPATGGARGRVAGPGPRRPLRLLLRSRPAAPEAPAPTPVAAASAGAAVVPMSVMRRRIAEHMVRSQGTSAHVYTSVEVDFEHVARVRTAQRDAWRAREGFSLTYLPFIARAVSDTIDDFPIVNASIDGDDLVLHPTLHLAIAVDLDFEGLIAPVIRDADGKRLRQIARDIHDLADACPVEAAEPRRRAGRHVHDHQPRVRTARTRRSRSSTSPRSRSCRPTASPSGRWWWRVPTAAT